MKRTNSIVAILAITAVSLFSSCSKDGATGPAGATGSTGAAGPTGPAGNPNIKDSTYTVTSWSVGGAYDYTSITDPEITSTIISSGTVSVFMSTNGTGWDNLNWSSENPTGYTMDYQYTLNTVTFYFSGGGSPNTAFSVSSIYFKVICIPSGIMKQNPGTNWKDYNQVMAIEQNNKN